MYTTTRSAGLLAAGLLLALTACGGQSETSDGAAGSGGTAADVADDLADVRSDDVPDACVAAFPLALEPADIDDVALRPTDFPVPPVEGTLCQTSSTLDDQLTTADYATDASAVEVLDAYERQLATRYELVRADNGAGETLTGDLGDGTFVEIIPGDGPYSVAFGVQ